MSAIKGPAVEPEMFRVEGHCCGIRIPALMDAGSDGLQFEISPEMRTELLQAGIRPGEESEEPPKQDKLPEPRVVSR